MIPYWVFFGIFAVAAGISNPRSSRHYTPLLLGAAVLVIVVVGLRYETGGDWFAYIDIFRRIELLRLGQALQVTDPGYALIDWIGAQAGFGMWFTNIICAAIFTYGLIEIARDQPNRALALLVAVPYLIIVVAMGYTRQSAALGLVMVALSLYSRGEVIRTAIMLVLAVAMHKSAIIVIPLIGLTSSKDRLLTAFLLLVAAITTYYVFVFAAVDSLMANYVEAEYSSSGAGIRVAMNLVPAAIFLIARRRFQMEPQERRLWLVFSFAAIMALILLWTTPSSTAVDRASLFLIPLQMVVLSRVPGAFPNRRGPSVALKFAVIVYSALVLFVWLKFADNSHHWVPYRNYLTEQTIRI